MMSMKKYQSGVLLCSPILSLTVALATVPVQVWAVEPAAEPETVRVGFFALDGYHEMDEEGNKSGYDYDFFHLTEKYANLNYEYVGYDKSWEETLQMLQDGEIDVVTSAYETEERMELFDFSMPIGTSAIDINTRASETRFVAGDYSTYDGMTLGLIKAASENDLMAEFAEENGFTYTAKYYNDFTELAEALANGDVDAVATTSLRKIADEKTLSEFDMQEFYAIVKKGNTELLNKINYAITQLNSSEGDWKNDFYYDNYMANNYEGLNFTAQEQAFIERYSTGGEQLVIATDNDWKPFSWKEGNTYLGIIPDYVEACMQMCGMNYTYYEYDDSVFDVWSDDMKKVDIYACYGLPDDESEKGFVDSAPFVENGAAYLQRRDGQEIKTLAISASTPHLNSRLDGESGMTLVEYPSVEEAKQAVLDGDADAAFVYEYDAEYTVNQDSTGKFVFTVVPGENLEIRAVINEDSDHTLMSILMKCIHNMPDTQKTSMISDYVSFSVEKMTLADYFVLHPVVAVIVCAFVLLAVFVIVIILLRNKEERKFRANLEGKVDEITRLNGELQDNQEKLEETTAEQEAQLEEISALNDELEVNQEKLEETTAEQEAQLEEISALNDELETQQGKLEVACKQAEAANNAKTSFLFNMSHDIRTPMNAIIGFADLLEKHQENPEKRADYIRKIQDSGAVLLSIINNVLEMARIEKGTLAVDEVAWSAEQFNDTLYSVFTDMMREKDIAFTRQIDVQHQYVRCDPIKLREIFINILSNAYKYTNSGGKVHMHLEEIPSDREGYAMYKTTISDTGIGMAEDFLPHIFEEFSRENNTTDNKIEGTGLGMPIVKRLVDILEGTIEVKSKKDVGTTFVVTIPHKIAKKSDLASQQFSGETDLELFKGKRILLAEDNELNAEIAMEILGEVGFAVDRAEDGQVCVDMLKQSEDDFYDVILMDIQMPNLNGYEATRAIRELSDEKKANTPIIAMTANAFEEDKRDAMRAGMNGHLAKPINVRELYKTLMGIFE
jgi:signal transduction histidine kinase/ABC-type amino acid transport substrate-binding protein/ActR/RegA family two-component response regulator